MTSKTPEQLASDWAKDNTGIILLSDEPMTRAGELSRAYLAGFTEAKNRFMDAWDMGFEAGKQFFLKMQDEGE
jgi:hypothetical protein